jgi:hypothetical protein
MKRSKVVMSTTHVDSHNERLQRRDLEAMAEDLKSDWVPLWYEHDPRIPPNGRVVDGYVEELEDGEVALVGIVEQFEASDNFTFDNTRAMKIARAPACVSVEFDRSYRDRTSQALIVDMSNLLGTEARPQAKKALDPLSILTLTVQATLGGIVGAVAKTVTDDVWAKLKKKISLALARRRDRSKEYVFQWRFAVVVGGREVEVDLLATCPSESQLDRIFHRHLATTDAVLLEWLPNHPEIRRVVFDVGGSEAKFSYALRSDVVAVYEGPKPGRLALRCFQNHDDAAITSTLNEVYATEASDLDPVLQSIQSRSVK